MQIDTLSSLWFHSHDKNRCFNGGKSALVTSIPLPSCESMFQRREIHSRHFDPPGILQIDVLTTEDPLLSLRTHSHHANRCPHDGKSAHLNLTPITSWKSMCHWRTICSRLFDSTRIIKILVFQRRNIRSRDFDWSHVMEIDVSTTEDLLPSLWLHSHDENRYFNGERYALVTLTPLTHANQSLNYGRTALVTLTVLTSWKLVFQGGKIHCRHFDSTHTIKIDVPLRLDPLSSLWIHSHHENSCSNYGILALVALTPLTLCESKSERRQIRSRHLDPTHTM